jgi:hypothetical protein
MATSGFLFDEVSSFATTQIGHINVELFASAESVYDACKHSTRDEKEMVFAGWEVENEMR